MHKKNHKRTERAAVAGEPQGSIRRCGSVAPPVVFEGHGFHRVSFFCPLIISQPSFGAAFALFLGEYIPESGIDVIILPAFLDHLQEIKLTKCSQVFGSGLVFADAAGHEEPDFAIWLLEKKLYQLLGVHTRCFFFQGFHHIVFCTMYPLDGLKRLVCGRLDGLHDV